MAINRRPIFFVLFSALLCWPLHYSLASTPSTSPVTNNPTPSLRSVVPSAVINDPSTITFSEFPLGTAITNQYANKGIIFGGDSPFISVDGANPTAPVLSGSPRFIGAIEGIFVDPSDKKTPIIASGFSLDAGYLDELGSVRLTWYSPNGTTLGQKIGSHVGIETFTVEGGSIARWRIETIKDEPSGFAIDNVTIRPLESALVFREHGLGGGFWGRILLPIPGFDHVGLLVDDLVYESNVGYVAGTYVDRTGNEKVINDKSPPAFDDGVQYFHTKNTFEWDALIGEPSTVSQYTSVAIPTELATNMRDHILTKKDAPFLFLGGGSDKISLSSLVPENQKGGGPNGGFTCVGLVEWSAESSGHNNGVGFIYDKFEEITVTDIPKFQFAWPPVSLTKTRYGLLSPELLYQSTGGTVAQAAKSLQDIKEWFQGFFDPVDFIITDPLGRRLGHTEITGTLKEIPRAFYSGDGDFEQFLIVGAVPGLYKIELVGLGKETTFGMASEKHAVGMKGKLLASGEKQVMYFVKEVVSGGMGDVNGDGNVDMSDVISLESIIPIFTAKANDPSDLNGDGILDTNDVALLLKLIEVVNEPYPQPVINCDINGDGKHDGRDIKLFQKACKTDTAQWLCDINGDNLFDGRDVDVYGKQCRAQ